MNANSAVVTPQQDLDASADPVHAWRVSQLTRLGLAQPVADAVADMVDWHAVASLVGRGCPAPLAVTIVA